MSNSSSAPAPTGFPLTVLVVGGHFRPPAKQILAAAQMGLRLTLHDESENPYDSSAIRVELDPQDLSIASRGVLAESLEGTGFTLEELLTEGLVHVGYVAKTGGKLTLKAGLPGNAEVRQALAQALGVLPNDEGFFAIPEDAWEAVKATLVLGTAGEPMAQLALHTEGDQA